MSRIPYHMGEDERHLWPQALCFPCGLYLRDIFRSLRSCPDNDTIVGALRLEALGLPQLTHFQNRVSSAARYRWLWNIFRLHGHLLRTGPTGEVCHVRSSRVCGLCGLPPPRPNPRWAYQ